MFSHSKSHHQRKSKQFSRQKPHQASQIQKDMASDELLFFERHNIPLFTSIIKPQPDRAAESYRSEPLSFRNEQMLIQIEKKKMSTKNHSITQSLIQDHERLIEDQKIMIGNLQKELLSKQEEVKQSNTLMAQNILLSSLEIERMRRLVNQLTSQSEYSSAEFLKVQKSFGQQLQVQRLALSEQFQLQLKQLRNQMKAALELLKSKHHELILELSKANQEKLTLIEVNNSVLTTENALLSRRIQEVLSDRQHKEMELNKYISQKIDQNVHQSEEFNFATKGRQELMTKLQNCRLELLSTKAVVIKYELVIEKLKDELAMCSKEILDLKSNIKQQILQSENKNISIIETMKSEKNNQNKQCVQKLQKQVIQLTLDVMNVKQEAQKDIKIKDIEIQKLKAQVQKLTRSLVTLQSANEQITSELQSSRRIKHILSDATTEETSLQTEPIFQPPQLQQNLQDPSEQIEKLYNLDQIQQGFKQIILSLEQEIIERDYRILLLEKHIHDLKQQNDAVIEEKNNKICLLLDLNDQQPQIKSMPGEIVQIEIHYKGQVQKYLEQITLLQGQLDKMQLLISENKQLKGQVAIKDELIQQKDVQLTQLYEKIERQKKQILQLEKQLQEKKSAMEQMVNMYQQQMRMKATA